MLGHPFNIKKLNEIGSFFIFELGLILQFLSISRRDFVSNSRLLVESTTQIAAEIVLLSGAAYPEFRLTDSTAFHLATLARYICYPMTMNHTRCD